MSGDGRRFKRYNVTNLPVEGQLENRSSEGLVTLGGGGCGFYGFEEDPHLRVQKLVTCTLRWDEVSDEAVKIPGRIVFCKIRNSS